MRPSVLNHSAALGAVLVLATAACGDSAGDTDAATQETAARAAATVADPKAEWLAQMTGLCTALAGKVSGAQLQLYTNDGVITPGEVAAEEKRAAPAVAGFDAGAEALTVPPEAQAAKQAWDAYLALRAASLEPMLAAATAGDQQALTAAMSAREAEDFSPAGVASLTAAGLPEKCGYRGSYSQ